MVINDFINAVQKFDSDLRSDPNARYRSWEHCYRHFYLARNQENPDYDYLSLQLAYYLASWGMLRGSSFLLWKDYKIHIPMVKEMLKSEYDGLQGVECSAFQQKEIQHTWQKLNTTLANYYESVRKSINDNVKKGISSVLLSKILLGTLACVPAYDRFFMYAVKEHKVASSIYGINSLISLAEFYSIYHNELENLRKTLAFDGIPYPQMKLLDMGFWQLGVDTDIAWKVGLEGKS